MMNYFSNRKKWMAYLILLTFVFTCIVPTNLAGGNEAWAATSDLGYTMELTNPDGAMDSLIAPDAGEMTARKYGELVDSSNGIVKITLETKNAPVNTTDPVDLILIMDESGSLNMLSNKNGTAMPCLNGDHYYKIPGGYLENYYPTDTTGFDTAYYNDTDAYITFSGSDLQGVQLSSWASFYPDDYMEKFCIVLRNAVKSDGKTSYWKDSDDFNQLNFTGKSHNSLLNKYPNTKETVIQDNNGNITNITVENPSGRSFSEEHYYWDGDSFQLISHASKDYPNGSGNTTIHPNRVKCAWSPEISNRYGCFDRMTVSRNAAHILADNIWNANEVNRVAYVGFTRDARSFEFSNNDTRGNVEEAILETDGCYGTSYLDGLVKATELIENAINDHSKAPNERSCYIVFLSDGAATDEDIKNEDIVVTTKEKRISDAAKELVGQAVQYYGREKVKVEAIGYNVSDAQDWGLELIGEVEAGITNYENYADDQQLINAFEDIWKSISKSPSGILTDTIGEDFELIEESISNEGAELKEISSDKKTLTWNITQQATTVSFYVQLKPENLQDVGYATYLTNADTPTKTGANLEYKPLEVDSVTHKIVEGSPVNIPLESPELMVRGKYAVVGTKTWIDGGKQHDNASEITLVLERISAKAGSVSEVVNATPVWNGNNYSFNGLEMYDREGNQYTYTVTENEINGYTSERVVDNATGDTNFINTIEQKLVWVKGEKSWGDNAKHENDVVKLDLFRDGHYYKTTETSLDVEWKYSFDNLPRYAINTVTDLNGIAPDGHEFEYQVREQEVKGYVPSYSENVDADGNYIVNITNNVRDEKTPLNILGKKIWTDGNDKHDAETEKVEIQLFRSDMPEKAWKTTETAIDWTYSFTDLPKYNDNNEWITYTVKEGPIDGYISAVVPTSEGFDIVNTPYVENQGQIAVGKVVTTEDGATPPPAGTEFEFSLKIKAELDQREFDKTVAKEEAALKEAYDKAVSARDRAEIALNGSADGTEKGAVGKFMANAFMTTPSQYQFIMTGDNNDAYYAANTSPSAYVYKLNGETVEKQEDADTDILASVLDAIKELAKSFSSLYNETSFMHQLAEKAEGTSPSALAFRLSDASELLEAHNAYNAADKLVTDTFNAWDNYNVTTPTAIKVFWTDSDNKVTEIKKDIADLVEGWYHIGFKLLDKEVNSFEVEATTGSMITFSVTETGYAQADATEITVKDGDVTEKTISGRFTDLWNLTTESAYGFTFNNIYKPHGGGGGGEIPTTINRSVEKVWNDNNNPNRPDSIKVNLLRNGEVVETVTLSAANGWDYNWYNLDASYIWSVQEVDVADGYTASVSRSGNTFTITNTLTTTSTIPDETIPDDNVPTGSVEPGEPLDEPEIPLGDAPATGDTNNAAPFMALMLFAVAGLVITRRKFN